MKTMCILQALLIMCCLISGCTGWRMDYGQPAAQFLDKDVAVKGKEYVGKKITVKGTVIRIDVSNPKSAWIYLPEGIRCNLGTFKAMAENTGIGETVYVDGILAKCEEGDVVLKPAMLRDPKAPFTPK